MDRSTHDDAGAPVSEVDHLVPDAGNRPVFVVGAARSGTTLLYSVILSAGEFPVYRAESRILECSTRYGKLTSDRNFDRFLSDYFDSRQFSRSGLDRAVLRNAPRESRRSYASFLKYFMDSVAAADGKSRWVEKSPNHLLFMPELSRAFPDALFVHSVRDGRDVALSQRRLRLDRAPTSDPLVQLMWAAKHWEVMVRSGREFGRRLGPRYLEVRYEDLVSDSSSITRDLGQFLGADITLAQVRESGIGALGKGNTAFGEKISGLSQRALGRWRRELDEREAAAIEWAIGPTLREFGYQTEDRDETRDIPWRARVHAHVYPVAMRTKRILNKYTPVGRRSRKPLEIGLS